MQDPDLSELKEQQVDEQSFQEKQLEIEKLTDIQKQMFDLKGIQNDIDILVNDSPNQLDLVDDHVQNLQQNTNNIKKDVENGLDNTLNLRATKITLGFSGVFGALSMIKGFGLTIGATVGGLLGRKVGNISKGTILEKVQD